MTSSSGKVASQAIHAGGMLVEQLRARRRDGAGAGQPASGWLAVTVFREASDIDAAHVPAPLAELGDQIEVRVRPAADGKGTELAARLRDGASSGTALEGLSGSDPQSDLRSALRRAKQLIEVGEVLAVDPAPHGERTPTPGGLLLEAWTKVAPKAGVR
ncbi:MAG: hypothetical protein ACJ72A_03860 [Nocardioidaceae bacterium]